MPPVDEYLVLKHRHDDLTDGPQFASPPEFTSFGYFKKRIIKITNYIFKRKQTQIQMSALKNNNNCSKKQ